MRIGRSGAGRDPTDPTYHWWESTRAEQDHLEIPVPYRWRIAGTVIGAIVVTIVLTIVLAEDDSEPIEYRSVVPAAIEVDADANPRVTSVEVEVEVADSDVARIKVKGDDIVRVEITGRALCNPVSGTDDAWLEVTLCGRLDALQVTATNEDDEPTLALARF